MGSIVDIEYEINYNIDFKPNKSSKTKIKRVVIDNKPVFILRNYETGETFEIDKVAHVIWERIDGKHSIAQIQSELGEMLPSTVNSEVISRAVKNGLLFFYDKGVLKCSEKTGLERKRVVAESPFELDVRLLEDGDSFIGKIHRMLKPIFVRPMLWLSVIFILATGVFFANTFMNLLNEKTNFQILGSTVVGLLFFSYVLLLPIIIVHEISHGLALKHYGGRPAEIGSGLYYFDPFFYVDASDAWTLGKWQRIGVSMAGPISTLLIGAGCALLAVFVPVSTEGLRLLNLTAFWCFYLILYNLIPLLETDGYYTLMDLVNMPNLRQDAFDYLKNRLSKIAHKPEDSPANFSKKQRAILITYAFSGVAWLGLIIYSTAKFTLYLVQDTIGSTLNIYNIIASKGVLTISVVAVGVVSIGYLLLTAAGYGVAAKVAIQKARIKTIKFELIHDVKLAVFFYLPSSLSRSDIQEFHRRVHSVSKKFAHKVEISVKDGFHVAQIGMSGAKEPAEAIEMKMKKMELAFRKVYERFLLERKSKLLGSSKTHDSRRAKIEDLLIDISKDVAGKPVGEIEKDVIDEQERALGLLFSTFGSLWVFSLPLEAYKDLKKDWIPNRLFEDIAIQDYSQSAVRFRKEVFNAERLASFALRVKEEAKEVFNHPEVYQASVLFEPIKNRLSILGRTDEIEKEMFSFGSFLMSGELTNYFDQVLGEMTPRFETLSDLCDTVAYDKEAIETLSDGELTTLRRNLVEYLTNHRLIVEVLNHIEKQVIAYRPEVAGTTWALNLPSAIDYKIGFLETVFQLNVSKAQSISENISRVRDYLEKVERSLKGVLENVKEEWGHREQVYLKKRHKFLALYSIVILGSLGLLSAGLLGILYNWLLSSVATGIILAATVQVVYLAAYYSIKNSFMRPGKLHNSVFEGIQLYMLAATEAVISATATTEILEHQNANP
jgi:hypothetical protein